MDHLGDESAVGRTNSDGCGGGYPEWVAVVAFSGCCDEWKGSLLTIPLAATDVHV
jgi:hypothetical protein